MNKDEARKRADLLKRLREQHAASVEATQALLKDLQAVRKSIRQAMQAGPKTVPELATDIQLPTQEVLWHVIAMKKYGLVTEAGLDDGYYRYRLPEEAKA
jgi:predicted transcriptional regulator